MGTYGYISCIALFCYVFMLLLMLAARRNKIANSFLILLIAMICWTGGSLVYEKSDLARVPVLVSRIIVRAVCPAALDTIVLLRNLQGKPKKSESIFYGVLYLLLFAVNVPAWIFAGTAGAGEDG